MWRWVSNTSTRRTSGRQLGAQAAQTRARVEHDSRVGLGLQLDARCVAAVADRVGSR